MHSGQRQDDPSIDTQWQTKPLARPIVKPNSMWLFPERDRESVCFY